jgi:hypothetical protein
VGVGGTELYVELLLPDSGGVTELGWPGGSQVASQSARLSCRFPRD